jgi:glycosyltransferase involved in cell wall biosynthesis
MKISVIICTHNPRVDYLQKTLNALRGQTLRKEEWELLLIDNASKSPLCDEWNLLWHLNSRHIREDELGLTPSRLRGIRESLGKLLVFVDDDNLLPERYLEKAWEIANKYPSLGCYGASKIVPEYEEEPAEDLKKYTCLLALRDQNKDLWSNRPDDNCVPWGAGLCVVKDVAQRHADLLKSRDKKSYLDRIGSGLLSGGDNEFSHTACAMGYGKGIFKELQLTHLISAKRVQKKYLLQIAEGHGYSNVFLDAMSGKSVRSSRPSIKRTLLALFRFQQSSLIAEIRLWKRQFELASPRRHIDRAWNRGEERAINDLAKI